MAELPDYDDLPVRDGAPAGSTWGLWGDDDRLGCLNLLTPERVVAAARLIRRGIVFALNAPVDVPDPPLFGRQAHRHEVLGPPDGPGHDDLLHHWNTQSSSQWDGFRHIRHPDHGWYGGAADGDHGIDAWAERGLAGRAVLVDVARWRSDVGRPLAMDRPDPISPDDLGDTLASQGTTVQTGDVLLLRTGWLGWYLTRSPEQRRELAASHANPGLAPGPDTARALWELGPAAVAADNPALEVWPPGGSRAPAPGERAGRNEETFLHLSLLPLLGLPIGELFALDELADDCAADGRYEAFFVSAPLRVPAGVASPPNALAIK